MDFGLGVGILTPAVGSGSEDDRRLQMGMLLEKILECIFDRFQARQ